MSSTMKILIHTFLLTFFAGLAFSQQQEITATPGMVTKIDQNFDEVYASVTALYARQGVINVTDPAFGAACDADVDSNGTDDTAEIQAAVDSIPDSASGVIYIPRLCKISGTINVLNKQAVAFIGPQNSYMIRPATFVGPTAGLVEANGWPSATTPMIKVKSTLTGSEQSGAFTMANLSLVPENISGTGWGVLFEKDTGAAKNAFIGHMTFFNVNISYFAKGIAIDDSANHSFSAPTANGNGFGWLTVMNSMIQGNTYGIHTNCDVHAANIAYNKMAHSHGASSGNYLTRTGGAIVWKSGSSLNVFGNDLEDSEVGLQTSGRSTYFAGNYLEAMQDAAVVLSGARDVYIGYNYTLSNPSFNTDQVFVSASRNVRLEANSNAGAASGTYLILNGLPSRDITTDSPERTRFDSATDGSQTIDDKGVVVQSLSLFLKQPPIVNTHVLSSAALSNATQAEITGPSPLGIQNKGMAVTATSANGKMQPSWGSVPVVAGQWLVTSMVMRMDSTVNADSSLLVINENKGLGAGVETVYSNTLNSGVIPKGDNVVIQWHHKVGAGEDANFSTTMESRIPGSGDVQKVYGVAQVLSQFPLVRPQSWEIVSSGGTERYLTPDGRVFYGANAVSTPPAATTLTWRVGDQVWRNAPAAGESPGWICTTAGAGGTAVFEEMGHAPLANPSASIGLSATNGVATTGMRSDAAPALSQSIAPTWTGGHTFNSSISGITAPIVTTGNTPGHVISELDQASGAKIWREYIAGGVHNWDIADDAGGTTKNWLSVARTGAAVTSITLGNSNDNNTIVVPSTGNINLGGQVATTTAGKGFTVKEGSNAKQGVATLVGGTVTVSTTAVTASSRIYLTSNVDGGTPGWLRVSAKTNGTSFVITSSSASDTSTVAWIIVEAG